MRALAAPSLRELQRWFASVTTHPDGVLDLSVNFERSRQLERLVTRGPRLSAADRLQIYNDAYFARLIECLTDDYPALSYALGEHPFTALARDYIAAHPSRSRSLNDYGQQMTAFCSSRSEPWAAFAADLARLEWALVEVVHEPATAGLTAEALAAVAPERLRTARFLASPALRLLTFEYPVNDFFQAFRDELAPSMPEPSASATVVYRRGLRLWRMQVDPHAGPLLQDLLSGMPLGEAIAALEARTHDPADLAAIAARLSEWLGAWTHEGFFAAVE